MATSAAQTSKEYLGILLEDNNTPKDVKFFIQEVIIYLEIRDKGAKERWHKVAQVR